jgi:predicted transcriptional regulator YheO
MSDQELKQALSDVAKALDKVNKAFENHLQEIKKGGNDLTMIRQTNEAVQSLRDSGVMYLAWAYHYAGVPLPGEQAPSAEDQ